MKQTKHLQDVWVKHFVMEVWVSFFMRKEQKGDV